jgi:competence ComEA-like helix-hairpin-helix protein
MTESESLKLNPNTADAKSLQKLPGIGPSLAQRIMDARPFTSVEDMLNIRGIGSSALDRMKPHLVFDPPSILEGAASVKRKPIAEKPKIVRPTVEVHQPVISSNGRKEQVSAELEAVAEAPEGASPLTQKSERQVASGRESKARKFFSRTETFWLVIAGGVLTLLFSVVLNLAILAGINGTLDFNRLQAVRQLGNDLVVLEGNLQDLSSSLDALDQRLTPLEGLTSRMVTVEGQVEALRQDVGDALNTVELMQSDLAQLSDETSRLSGRVDSFDTFFDGLRQLLNEIFAAPSLVPTPES